MAGIKRTKGLENRVYIAPYKALPETMRVRLLAEDEDGKIHELDECTINAKDFDPELHKQVSGKKINPAQPKSKRPVFSPQKPAKKATNPAPTEPEEDDEDGSLQAIEKGLDAAIDKANEALAKPKGKGRPPKGKPTAEDKARVSVSRGKLVEE